MSRLEFLKRELALAVEKFHRAQTDKDTIARNAWASDLHWRAVGSVEGYAEAALSLASAVLDELNLEGLRARAANPLPEEVQMFGLGNRTAERLATAQFAERVGISLEESRTKLQRIAELSREIRARTSAAPFVTEEV